MWALASKITGAGSAVSRPARPAKYAAAVGNPPAYSVSSPARRSGRSTRGCCNSTSTATRTCTSARNGGERVRHAACDDGERLRRGGLRLRHDNRLARVGQVGKVRLQRYLTQQRHAELVREPRATAREEDLGALAAVRADEVAHVLDHAEHRDADPLEHLRAAQAVPHRDLLRGRHDERAADVHRLRERQLRVACAGREVHEEVVERAPVHVAHELPDHLRSEEHTSELQSLAYLVCRLLLEKKKNRPYNCLI